MKLSKIKLYNYRCFGSEEQTITVDEFTTFIGNNSVGKTAALSALKCIFSENSGDRILQRSDFHLSKEMNPDEMESQNLYIEVIFEFDELRVDDDSGMNTVPMFFQYLVVDAPGSRPYLRIRLEAEWEKSNTIEGSIESKINYIVCPEAVTIAENYRVPAPRRELDKIRVIYVPAVRDPSKQLKNASGTMIYQIMSSINWSDATKENVKTKIHELNEQFESEKGVSMFGSSIAKQWKTYDSDDRYSTASLRFNSTDIETSIRATEVVFEPTVTGKEYTVDQMGDGLRSLFYISLVDSVLDIECQIQKELETNHDSTSFSRKPPMLTIVALEEPENHIAPHLLGKLVKNLKNIAGKNNAQAIITSHSPAIVKRVEPENIRYFRVNRENQTTIVKSITLPNESLEEQYKYVKEAVRAYPELYFAKLVILGEGDSEEIIIPRYWEALNGSVDLSGISVVPLGGRHVNHFWKLLNDLQIPHITLLDLDRERDGGGWGRIKYVLDQLIDNRIDINTMYDAEGGILTNEKLEAMSEWDNSDTENMSVWIDNLENNNVFFSSPLDIDFMMLETMGDIYKQTLSPKEGPRLEIDNGGEKVRTMIRDVENISPRSQEYEERIKHDFANTLKDCGGDGRTYNDNQKKLMVWYNYFFLNRGKPSTHIAALSKLDKEALTENIPDVLKRLLNRADEMLRGNNNENLASE